MGTPIYKGNTSTLVEQPESPTIEYGDTARRTHEYWGTFALCSSSMLPRGTFGSGAETGYVVINCTTKKTKNGGASLTIVWEGALVTSGATLPPDEWSLEPHDLNPKIERHSRYASLTVGERRKVKAAWESAVQRMAAQNQTGLSTAAAELLDKLTRGQETYYLAGMKYTWTTASWGVPSTTLGGIIQSPLGPLSGYLSGSLSWLRLSDELKYNGTIVKKTMSWLAGPAAFWDTDIYS